MEAPRINEDDRGCNLSRESSHGVVVYELEDPVHTYRTLAIR